MYGPGLNQRVKFAYTVVDKKPDQNSFKKYNFNLRKNSFLLDFSWPQYATACVHSWRWRAGKPPYPKVTRRRADGRSAPRRAKASRRFFLERRRARRVEVAA